MNYFLIISNSVNISNLIKRVVLPSYDIESIRSMTLLPESPRCKRPSWSSVTDDGLVAEMCLKMLKYIPEIDDIVILFIVLK